MDFAALPPEINSARMYIGPGSAPMMTSASAWNALDAELTTSTASCESVIAMLTGEVWHGSAAAAMAAATRPYLAWLNSTAVAARQAAAQATASAAAFEAAHAMTVPPTVIAANRSQLAALVATNFLGQNNAAIAATEALYAEMWVQDAVAMYTYAATSAAAAVLQPLSSPKPTTNPGGLAGQAAAATQATGSAAGQSGLSQLLSGLPGVTQSLSNPLDGLNNFLGIPLVQNSVNGSINTAAWVGMNAVPTLVSLAHSIGASGPGALSQTIGSAGLANAALVGTASPAVMVSASGAPALAGVGQAARIGGLSVPANWATAAPATTGGTAALPAAGWTAAADEGMSMEAVPAGMPTGPATGRSGFGFGTPRYGFKPTVMPRPLVG